MTGSLGHSENFTFFLSEMPKEVFKQSWKNSTVLCNLELGLGGFLTVNKFLIFCVYLLC